MRRKIVAILLAVMTVSTAVIGCGDNKTTETESKKVQTSTETSDHDEIKKYIKNADEIVIVKDAKNLDLEKAVNSLVSEEQKAKVESVTVDDSKVDSTKAGTYPLTITVKLKAETTEQNIASSTTESSTESQDASTTEKEPDTVKDTVDVIVAEKKDAEDLLNKGSAVIGDDSKVEVKEDKKNASNDGKEEEKKILLSRKCLIRPIPRKKSQRRKIRRRMIQRKNLLSRRNMQRMILRRMRHQIHLLLIKNRKQQSLPHQRLLLQNRQQIVEVTKIIPIRQKHNYVAQTHVVHHEATGHNEPYVVQDAWDEQVTTYEDYPWDCCNVCGADCTADPGGHAYQHAIKGEGGGHHTEYDSRPVTKTVHHDAVYGTRWVQDTAAYDETVVDGYVCSCGARK